jgi:hypothetical protein
VEYAAGIFLSILSVAVLVNLRAGTLPDWFRAKFLNLAPGQSIPTAAAEPSPTAKGLSKTQTGGGGGSGGSQIQQIKTAVARQFASEIASGDLVTKGGVTSCRPMKPQPRGITHIAYSEHAWSNAWDLYFGGRSKAVVRRVVSWLKAEKAAGRLPVGSILTYGWSGSHVHIEGAPKRNPKPWVNTPPCAQRSSVSP